MITLRKIATTAGILFAPWLYLGGRALAVPRASKIAANLDPRNLRYLEAGMHPEQSRLHVSNFFIAALLAAEVTPEAAERIKQLLAISESQLLQDIFCAIALREKRNGFFVEVGVGSGKAISNTYMLEKHYGWKGLLVEPNRSSHASISASRTAILERRAAASKSGEHLRFQEMVDAGEHSRVAGTGGHAMVGARTAEYQVETVSLTEVLDDIGAPTEIDFLSLDTEGSELDILAGLDLHRYSFKVMAIEHNFDSHVQQKLDSLLRPLGYRLVLPHISGFDAWYLHSDVSLPNLHSAHRRD